MKLIFVTLVTVTCIVFGLGDCCITPTGIKGRCVLISSCEKLKRLIKGSLWDREFLKQHHCGFVRDVPMVCCTNVSSDATTSATVSPLKTCATLQGTIGTCVEPQTCPNIARKLIYPSKENIDYVERSRCKGTARYDVCCDMPVDPITTQNPEDTSLVDDSSDLCPPSPGLPDPNSSCCGIETELNKNINYNGRPTSIDQHPWLVLIEYTGDYMCGGSLISSQYVLTAAHCIVTPTNKPRGAKSVRLGEYNTTNDGSDCIEIKGVGTDCTAGAISIPIAETTVHPDFNSNKFAKYTNDIALIKLSEMALYNDFIRPICLPTLDITQSPTQDIQFVVAGWGTFYGYGRTSDIKRHVDLPYVDQKHCQRMYSKKASLWNKQICAGGEFNKDSCRGDSGGPLMNVNNDKYELIGVISFGVMPCLKIGIPSVHTKVHAYLPWIKNIIKS